MADELAQATTEPPETRNLVICCDGTGNEVTGDLSNVLKLFRIAEKNADQIVYYDPGVGTIGTESAWQRRKAKLRAAWGLATGAGLDENILDAYRFLVQNYRDGDRVFLFGFSRGAYTVRALAAFLNMVGLLYPNQVNLADYALTTYKRSGWRKEREDEEKREEKKQAIARGETPPADNDKQGGFRAAWDFGKIVGKRRVPIHFMGCWDTVASMIVPGRGLFSLPTLRTLPYTRRNPDVRAFRHAMAIDERRRMFRPNRWADKQQYLVTVKPRRLEDQDCKQVWFAGVHSDIGGGYPEKDSGLAKFPLIWMIVEAVEHGLLIDDGRFAKFANGVNEPGDKHHYVAPDACGMLHNSLTKWWWPLELPCKSAKWRRWPLRRVILGFYWPLGEPRLIPTGAVIHPSVADRQARCDPPYQPANLPPRDPLPDESPVSAQARKVVGVLKLVALLALVVLIVCLIKRCWF